jgi:hypothetical protein
MCQHNRFPLAKWTEAVATGGMNFPATRFAVCVCARVAPVLSQVMRRAGWRVRRRRLRWRLRRRTRWPCGGSDEETQGESRMQRGYWLNMARLSSVMRAGERGNAPGGGGFGLGGGGLRAGGLGGSGGLGGLGGLGGGDSRYAVGGAGGATPVGPRRIGGCGGGDGGYGA